MRVYTDSYEKPSQSPFLIVMTSHKKLNFESSLYMVKAIHKHFQVRIVIISFLPKRQQFTPQVPLTTKVVSIIPRVAYITEPLEMIQVKCTSMK